MTEPRTAAQSAQDKNKAKDGKFQHNVNAESNGVVLDHDEDRYKVYDQVQQQVTPGPRALAGVQKMTKKLAVDMYCNNLGAAVKAQHPDADRIEYLFHDDKEYGGSTATFLAIRDKDGNKIDGDPALFGENSSALADEVDADALHGKLTNVGEDDEGWNIGALKLDEIEHRSGLALSFEAQNYAQEVKKVQAELNAQLSQANAAVLGHDITEKMPDIEEFELTYCPRGVNVGKVTTKAGTFRNPRSDEPGTAGLINWAWLDSKTDFVDFDETVMYRPIKVSDATSWRPGNQL